MSPFGAAPKGAGRPAMVVVSMADPQAVATTATLPLAGRLVGFAANGKHLLTETHEGGLISGAHAVQAWEVGTRQPGAPGNPPVAYASPESPQGVEADAALLTPGVADSEVRYAVREVSGGRSARSKSGGSTCGTGRCRRSAGSSVCSRRRSSPRAAGP